MDASIIQAIIAAAATIFAAILTPLVKWAIESLPSRSMPKESREKIYRIGFVSAAGIIFFGVLLTVTLFVSATNKYHRVIPEFGLAICLPLQSNSSMYFELQKGIPFPSALKWISPAVVELQDPSFYDVKTPKKGTSIPAASSPTVGPKKDCIFFESHLRPTHSWSGLMFSKGFSLFSLDLSAKEKLLLVLKAESQDIIELGLKDINENETKIKFEVSEGWHGYIIPMESFTRINKNRIKMFLISHSSGHKRVESNQFWLAFLDFR